VLWHDFFGNNQHPRQLVDQQITLIHELMHSFFKLGRPNHSDVTGRLGITPLAGETHFEALNRWIKDCLK
jgi:hypothetical protein